MSDTPLTDRVDDLINDEPSPAVALSKWRWHAQQMERDRNALAGLLRALTTEMESQMPPLLRGNAPGHAHRIPGVWDASGEPCHWCHLWLRVKWCLEKFRAQEAHHEI